MSRIRAGARILLIDNYDSFTYNLVQAFAENAADVLVFRNDAIDERAAVALEPTHLVISPGPGRPEDAGCSLTMIDTFRERIPLLGVCLGHQCLVSYFGGEIVRAERLMHGKTSLVKHDDGSLFEGISQPFRVGRYHSLCADRARCRPSSNGRPKRMQARSWRCGTDHCRVMACSFTRRAC